MTALQKDPRVGVSPEEIAEALKALKISLSPTETRALSGGKSVSLERKPLSEFGSLLVNADKVSQREQKKALTYDKATSRATPRSGALDPPSSQPSPGGNPDPQASSCRGTKILSFKTASLWSLCPLAAGCQRLLRILIGA